MGTCVIYVMDSTHMQHTALAAAQDRALKYELPLAVVHCTPAGQKPESLKALFADLLRVENELKTVDIPFMLLIGDTRERLDGLFYHVKPDAVYFDHPSEVEKLFTKEVAPRFSVNENASEPDPLLPHPHAWPGPVIPLQELKILLEHPETLC